MKNTNYHYLLLNTTIISLHNGKTSLIFLWELNRKLWAKTFEKDLEMICTKLWSKHFLGRGEIWRCHTDHYFNWKFFIIWFQKLLKLIFQTQPLCPRNIFTEHIYWTYVLNYLTWQLSWKFFYTLRTEHMQKV